MRPLLLFLLACALTGCYEERSGCLDPDAADYDLQADVACPDCCTYPELSVRVSSAWGDTTVVVGNTYTDGGGNPFQLIRFRYYLGDIQLLSSTVNLPVPARPVAVQELRPDTVDVEINGNYLLASAARTTTVVGNLRTGTAALNGLSGTYGLPDSYRGVIPASAPSGDALRTQPGRLNFRDGAGYVQARIEYVLPPGTDTLSVSSYGSQPFVLDFGDDLPLERGLNLRVDVLARLDLLLGDLDLTADSATIAAGLNQPVDFLEATGLIQQ